MQLVLVPGIGGDHRMMYPQVKLPYELIALDYIMPKRDESLSEYAKRWCKVLLESGTVSLAKPLFLFGVSLGSAIAQEMARHLSPRGLILVSSFTSRSDLPAIMRWLGEHVAGRLPNAFYNAAQPFVPAVMRLISRISWRDIKLCSAMYRDCSKTMFKRHGHMAACWTGCETAIPKLRIHGSRDHVIPFPASKSVIPIPGGRHLISMSAAEEVNRLTREFIERTLSEPSKSRSDFSRDR